MAPVPENPALNIEDMSAADQTDYEKIVISGMSGVFPQSHNIKELSDILYNKVNPVTIQDRWDYHHPELPQYVGMAPDLDRFDAQFFTVNHRIGHHLDPMSRKILENTFQALYDAGLSPGHLHGKKVAVFIGTSFSATENFGMLNQFYGTGLGLMGTNKTMFANRISYWLNLKGPSVSIDNADCSFTSALEQAYLAIRRGDCEAAIVGGAHVCLHPQDFIFHGRLGVISQDGQTRSYAADSNGYTLSDGVGVLILQKTKDALRCYAELVHIKNEFISPANDETGPKFGYYRDPENTAKFIKEFYKAAQVSPQSVDYVEGFGSGDPEADKCELEAIGEVYCENRETPLFVGSVMSNIGNTVAATGAAAIAKVLLGYHHGQLAANLHCRNPRQDITKLNDGSMRLITEDKTLHEQYVAINGMSVTGVNSHVLLKGNSKPKDLSLYKSPIPHLVLLSGRQDSSVTKINESLKSRPIDPEEISLYHNIHSKNLSGHLGRGYTILDTNDEGKTISLFEKAEYFDEAKRPLWFVFSGMGSQWIGMGTQLMRMPIFAGAIERCDRVLKPQGLDIVDIITSDDKTMFDNILHSMVGITSIQIGLIDILRELGLEPDGIIGHSVGELACAYADGCLSAEETILSAWSRGQVSVDTEFIKGSMAAVGLGYNQISTMCPPEVDVACHNGPDSSTISGPADVVRPFIEELTAKGIFSKEVPSANIAYHSRYIVDAGPKLLESLKEIIVNPKRRSKRWLSTSVPQDQWDEESAQYCSAEYQTNNLLNPVLFEETIRLIPSNAVLVEVAPHGLLQAILKRSLPVSCIHVPLTRRGHSDNVVYLLQAIGNLYVGGYTPKVQALYPTVKFPVSARTPMLSHLVEWVHLESWAITSYTNGDKRKTAACKFIKSVHDDDYSYLRGNVIQGKIWYPFAAALVAVWDTFAMISGATKRALSVQLQDVQLYSQPLMLEQGALKFEVDLFRGSGRFEVTTEFSKIMTGCIASIDKEPPEYSYSYANKEMTINSEDIYLLLKDRGFSYSDEFRSIESATASFDEADIVWRDNWVTLIDGMLQLNTLRQAYHGVSQPTHIRKLNIDLKYHVRNEDDDKSEKKVIKAVVVDEYDFIRCGGVIMHGISFRNMPVIKQKPLELNICSEVRKAKQLRSNEQDTAAKTLQSAQVGKLDTLHWVKSPQLERSNLNVKVHFAALNALDVKRATGVTPSDTNMYGMDFSGVTDSGERVMGIVSGGAASSQVRARPELLWPVPKYWSLEEAATVPLAYAHAFYALMMKGHLEPGMSVLVHGGVGALGQAVISIALAHHCQVFTTVSDTRKRDFLRRRFPQIKDEHIAYSRDTKFSDIVLSATRGVGCNIVISCVTGEVKNTSLKCCAPFGAVIDTAQLQEREIYNYGMNFMTAGRSYIPIDFSSLFTENKYSDMKLLQEMLCIGITAGYVTPLPRVTYDACEVTRAFRLMGTSQHRGRVLLRIQDNLEEVEQRITCDRNKCQVMYWDDDSISVQLAERLIYRGANKFYIFSKRLTSYQQLKLRTWQQLGVKVVISTKEWTKLKPGKTNVLKDAKELGEIEGIYIILSKSAVNNNVEDLSAVVGMSDKASRLLCPQLRYFAVVSSVKEVGQDTCVSRSKNGLMATYLNLSCLSEAGVSESFAIMDIIEEALCSDYVVLSARPRDIHTSTLLEQIATLTGVSFTQNDKNVTLKELGVRDEEARYISAYLDNTYNISLEDTKILQLTLDRIKDLEETVLDIKPPHVEGLKTFFNHVLPDEMEATTDLILLPTLCSEVLTLDDFALGERYLYIVPGMEGHHQRFHSLCERLKLPALVLQPGLDNQCESVEQSARRFADILKKKAEIQDNFYILGYEAGVSVALQLAAILEEQGLTGTVYCLGLAPEELQAELDEQLKDYTTQDELEDAVVSHMFTLLTDTHASVLDTALQQADTWTHKVDTCVRHALAHMSHSTQYASGLVNTALARIEQCRRHTCDVYLRSQIILLRADTKCMPFSSLQQYSQLPVITHQLGSSLCHVLNDALCPSLINRYLDEHLKKVFDTRNLCHTYNSDQVLRWIMKDE